MLNKLPPALATFTIESLATSNTELNDLLAISIPCPAFMPKLFVTSKTTPSSPTLFNAAPTVSPITFVTP